jgi:hypothetical protein
MNRRPYIGRIWQHTWKDRATGEHTPGIVLGAAHGIAAHLSADEALALADQLVDLAEQLPEATTSPQERQETPCGVSPLYTSQALTNASGDTEDPLPTTGLERE